MLIGVEAFFDKDSFRLDSKNYHRKKPTLNIRRRNKLSAIQPYEGE
ncbi:hypothetical protein HMPREF0653_01588 [Prevotella disiens JCM 6334 = ATCC 29426]|uniref:Uncharacterized protein n=2 Tax=Prevotella disiens TaxID=28130 RepID=E1KP61_9BACT|nr:hypothetical protein HMPREF9296_2599 [Prevotella disiens FB035-09AN]ERJ76091.1 hypothetical protein HMPREF0653_01588 [Prevotella disiens JCM 6334 = ATCC 29426]